MVKINKEIYENIIRKKDERIRGLKFENMVLVNSAVKLAKENKRLRERVEVLEVLRGVRI